LPTTFVSDRERGVWRRYRLAPVPTWTLIVSTALSRYVLVLTAGLLQFAAALAIGMTFPEHPLGLFLAFTAVAFAFIGLGLVIAMLADNVPAVQALGQCLFLPMLIIGGVAVPLGNLPPWAQHVSAFFPGRYAVEALQACVTGQGAGAAHFSLLALTLIGFAGCVAGAKLFRWEPQQQFFARSGRGWLAPVFFAWLAVGGLAEWRGHIASTIEPGRTTAAVTNSPKTPGAAAARPQAPWESITAEDVAKLDFYLPPDEGVVSPFARPDEEPSDEVASLVADVAYALPLWKPARVADEGERVSNLLAVCAVPDAIQMPVERYLPAVVLAHLSSQIPKARLIQILAWVSEHPDDYPVVTDLSELGLPNGGVDPFLVRQRTVFYALKFIMRLTGRKPPQ
jgi:ABC-2 type transport system permease protein